MPGPVLQVAHLRCQQNLQENHNQENLENL